MKLLIKKVFGDDNNNDNNSNLNFSRKINFIYAEKVKFYVKVNVTPPEEFNLNMTVESK